MPEKLTKYHGGISPLEMSNYPEVSQINSIVADIIPNIISTMDFSSVVGSNYLTTAAQSGHNHGEFSGTNITGTYNSSELKLSVAAPGGGAMETGDRFYINDLGASTHIAPGQNTIWLAPFTLTYPLDASSLAIMMTYTGTITSAVAATFGQTMGVMLLSRNSADSTRYDSMWSDSIGFNIWNSGTSSNSYNYGGTTSSTAGSQLLATSVNGHRIHSFVVGSTMTSGYYMFEFRQSTSTSGYSALFRTYNPVFNAPQNAAKNYIGLRTTATLGVMPGGIYSVTSNAMIASVGLSELRTSADYQIWFKIGAV